MANTMEKFLANYYKQLHFNAMPPEVRARFDEWVKKGTLTDEMKLWVRDYMTPDHKNKALPDPADINNLDKDEAKKLYIAFQQAFAAMAADKDKFKDSNPQAYKFVVEHFGDAGKPFQISPAKETCKKGIKDIIGLIQMDPGVAQIVLGATDSDNKKLFTDRQALDKFVKDCEAEKFNTNPAVRTKIKIVANRLYDFLYDFTVEGDGSRKARDEIEKIKESLDAVRAQNAFELEPNDISDDKLRDFLEIYAKPDGGLLQTLYYNKKIRDQFAKYDREGKIIKHIQAAEGDVNYQDSNQAKYVDPKYKDSKTPFQQLKDWAKDTYEDCFKKYEELRGAPLFVMEESKEIFKAIDKAEIKPSDGLKTLLDKAANVEKNLNNEEVRQHFKWFVETLEPIAQKMPNAVEGAWKNSTQMKAIIEQIILKATDPKNDDKHAMEKAQTAMEIMNAMKYGLMTSNIMDAMKQTEFSIFSDGKLSWNNNEAIQFVTRAFDKSIKAAFLGIGYAVTIVKNKISLSNSEFTSRNNRNNSELAKRFRKAQQNLIDGKKTLQKELTAEKNNRTQKEAEQVAALEELKNITGKTEQEDILNDAKTKKEQIEQKRKAEEDKRDKAQQEINKLKSDIESLKKKMAENEDGYNKYNELQRIIDGKDIEELREQTNKNNATIQKQINELEKILSETVLEPDPERRKSRYDAVNQQIVQLRLDITKNKQTLQDAINNKDDRQKEATEAQKQFEQAHKNYEDAKNDVEPQELALKTENNKLEAAKREIEKINNENKDLFDNVNKFDIATASIKEINKTIDEKQNALDNWDQQHINNILKLEEFWNRLQNGENKAWFGRTSSAQARFDQQKRILFREFLQKQSLAA